MKILLNQRIKEAELAKLNCHESKDRADFASLKLKHDVSALLSSPKGLGSLFGLGVLHQLTRSDSSQSRSQLGTVLKIFLTQWLTD